MTASLVVGQNTVPSKHRVQIIS